MECSVAKAKTEIYNIEVLLDKQRNANVSHGLAKFSVTRSLQILELLRDIGNRKTFYAVQMGEVDLAQKLQISRQALSLHFKKLRESGFVQIGRGFINVTEDGLRAIGYHKDPVIVTLRILPQKRSETIRKIEAVPAIEIFRVTGDMDVVLIVEQDKLDTVLEILSSIDGVIETKSLVSINTSLSKPFELTSVKNHHFVEGVGDKNDVRNS